MLREHVWEHLDERILLVCLQVVRGGEAAVHKNVFLAGMPVDVDKNGDFSFHLEESEEFLRVVDRGMQEFRRVLPAAVQIDA